jgi:hypothetical protein
MVWALADRETQATLAVLGPVATSEYFTVGSTIQSANTSLYLNIGSETTSYKSLTFGTTATTKAWALEGDTIITSQSSSYGRRESAPFECTWQQAGKSKRSGELKWRR